MRLAEEDEEKESMLVVVFVGGGGGGGALRLVGASCVMRSLLIKGFLDCVLEVNSLGGFESISFILTRVLYGTSSSSSPLLLEERRVES